MITRRELLTLSFIIMNDVLESEESNEETLMDLVDYGPEWHSEMNKLTVNMNDPILNKHIAKKILNNYMWSCPIHELDEKILSVVCPVLKQNINDIIDNIDKQLDNLEVMKNIESTTFDGEFIEIKNLLARWHEILKHIGKYKKTPSIIKSLLENLPNAIIKICSHCKNMRIKYMKRNLPLLLQDIYRDACSIVKNYCILVPKLFNSQSNDDIDALKMIICDLGNIAPYTTYGMSTMILTWKTFKFMACNANNDLIERKDFVDLVRGYFKSIGKSIIRLYKQIMTRPEPEFVTRAKCSNILLQYFIELHEFYCTDRCPYPLELEFIRDMVHIFIEFVGHFELCSVWNGDSDKCINRDRIIQNTWPKMLYNYYKDSEHWLTELHLRSREMKNINDPNYALGFHYCLLHYKVFNNHDLFDMTLENINYIQVEIIEQLIRMPEWITATGVTHEAFIYDYTLTHLCRTCNTVSFNDYEDILLKHLLGEQFWSSLLAYDILIYCYTCSNKDVALTHIQYFVMAYEALHERKNDSLAVIMLRRIIKDIYELLPDNKIDEFLHKCKSPAGLLVILQSDIKNQWHNRVFVAYKKLIFPISSSNLSGVIENLNRQPSVHNWMQLINLLTIMGIEQEEYSDEQHDIIVDITLSTIRTVKELDDDDDNKQVMMYNLILILFNCARIQDKAKIKCWLNWPLFLALSEGLLEMMDVPESILIKLCYYLTNNVDYLVGSNDYGGTSIITAVFIYLLENNSQLVHQEALECFDEIIEKSDENFVKRISNAIAKRPKLYEAVPSYLKREPFPKLLNNDTWPDGWCNYSMLSSHFNDFSMIHKCYKNNNTHCHNEKLSKLCEESLAKRIIRLANDLTELNSENIQFIPIDSVEKLKNACRSFIEN